MVRAALKQARRIERQDYVPDSRRTPDRDDAADWLESELVTGDRDWPETTIVELSEISGWSRGHIARTLDAYFEPAAGSRGDVLAELASEIDNVDPSGTEYADGFRDGFEAGMEFCLLHPWLIDDG